VRLFALRYRDAGVAQNIQRGRRGDWEVAMRAIDETGSIDNRTGQHAWLPEHFEANARANDIDDRIDRADLMKMNLLGGHAVNFSFGFGNACENGGGAVFHPRRQFAVVDQRANVRKASSVLVLVLVIMFMIVSAVLMGMPLIMFVMMVMSVGMAVRVFVRMRHSAVAVFV
jgi:hypothetical protein